MTAHNVRLTLQKLSRSAFLLTQSCGVGMSRPRGKRSGSRRVASVPLYRPPSQKRVHCYSAFLDIFTHEARSCSKIASSSVNLCLSYILPRFPQSGGSDSSLCEALFVQIDISRLDSVSRLGVFMHCLVFSQVFPRHFVQQSTTLRLEHIVAVKEPTSEPNLPLPRGDPRLNR